MINKSIKKEKTVSQMIVMPHLKRKSNGLAKVKLEKDDVWKLGQKIPVPPADLEEPQLSETAHYIGQTRYARRNELGEPAETDKEMFWRVAYNIGVADLLYDSDEDKMLETARKFYELMATQRFIPNTPTMLNAGKVEQQLSACFVLPVEDNMRSIGKTMVDMILIHKSGGGTGFSFSRLRPSGDVIASSGGFSTGPTAFLEAYNAVTSQVKQGGVRRGANMGIMHITHPDVLRFAVMKVDEFNLTNFNISVTVTEDWMKLVKTDQKFVETEPKWDEIIEEIKLAQQIRDVDLKLKKTEDGVVKLTELVKATKEGEGYELINPRDGKVWGKLNAYKVFLLITKLAWQYGDPGMILIDRINNSNANPTPNLGPIESTNPCGEQPLYPYDACTLGSLNVAKFVENGKINFKALGEATEDSIHFLDNVLDMNIYPIPEIAETVGQIRRVGLGVMGLADLFYKLAIPYDSEEALGLAEKVMACIQEHSKIGSSKLVDKRGVFPEWKNSIFNKESSYFRGENLKLRNSARTTIAPTGTISMLADVSSGIEPYFALSYSKNTIEGKRLFNANPLFLEVAKKEGFYSDDLLEKIEANNGSIKGLSEVPEKWQRVFVTTRDITPEWHVKMQAAFQKHVDNAISKTINFPYSASVEDVRNAYMLVYETECKGITIYRDGSRTKQVLEVKKDNSYYDQLAGISNNNMASGGDGRVKAPLEAWGMRLKKKSDVGNVYTAVFKDENDIPVEVFINVGKSGGYVAGAAEVTGRLASLALKRGASLEEIASELIGVACGVPYGLGTNSILSMFDAVGKSVLEVSKGKQLPLEEKSEQSSVQQVALFEACPECGSKMMMIEGCKKCTNPICGYAKC